jgi:guanylate kinase
MSILFIVSGASGAGKSTLCRLLLDRYEDLEMSVSTTTRGPRGDEQDGVHYHFVDADEFARMVEADAFAEWAEVHDNRYGTSRAVIDDARRRGKSVLFDVDYQGAKSLMATYPDAVAVMVIPPDMKTLEARLRGRGTDEATVVRRRMDKARAEMAHGQSFDYLIVNDQLEDAFKAVDAVYHASQVRAELVWGAVRREFDL